jgi:hypothetical protein
MSTPIEGSDVLAGPDIDVAGVAIRLGAADPLRADAVAALFRHASLAADAACTLTFTASPVAVPATEPSTTIKDLELWRPEPDRLIVRTSDGLTATASPDEIVVGGDAPSLARAFRFACSVALTHLLAQRGRLVLHGGAVVANGRALLVLGGTGTGKSTLVFSAVRLGWPALSDDLIALHREDDVVRAVGLPRPIAVPADVLGDGMPDSRPVPEDPRERTELPGPTLVNSVHPVGGLIVTSRGSTAETAVEPMAARDAFRAVLSASVSLADPAMRPEVFALGAALIRLPAWSLRHGTDAALRVETAGRRLEELRAHLDGVSAA